MAWHMYRHWMSQLNRRRRRVLTQSNLVGLVVAHVRKCRFTTILLVEHGCQWNQLSHIHHLRKKYKQDAMCTHVCSYRKAGCDIFGGRAFTFSPPVVKTGKIFTLFCQKNWNNDNLVIILLSAESVSPVQFLLIKENRLRVWIFSSADLSS